MVGPCRTASILALCLLCGCGGATAIDTEKDLILLHVHVDEVNGDDGNIGTKQAPFQTITHGLGAVPSGGSVSVAPGIYDAANGETFPLDVPQDVDLIGDTGTLGRGLAGPPTAIQGGGLAPGILQETAVVLRAGARIAGFHVRNPRTDATPLSSNVCVDGTGVTVEWCTLVDAGHGIDFLTAGGGVVHANEFEDNHFSLDFHSVSSVRVEANTFRGSQIAVFLRTGSVDLGGGSAGSTGQNTFVCNLVHLVATGEGSVPGFTCYAQHNFWDAVPVEFITGDRTSPTVVTAIINPGGEVVHTDNVVVLVNGAQLGLGCDD